MAEKTSRSKLTTYRRKRSAEKTREPFAGTGKAPGLFVVQKHAARQTHYDFRLEQDGVLWSWALPKGFPKGPGDKRLAVHVEDHPLDYADFEGVIPAGNYGAGEVIVWDRGLWTPLSDPIAGMAKGHLHFDLAGYKLKGTWSLIRLKDDPKNWIIVGDAKSTASAETLSEASVLSGLMLEELGRSSEPAHSVTEQLARLKTPKGKLSLTRFQPMLAETADAPFSKRGWIFELKYDGYRLIAERNGSNVRLQYRSGREATQLYPELVLALRSSPHARFVLDGEVVVPDANGRADFQRLQERSQLTRASDVARIAVSNPALYWAFDLLAYADYDLRPLPLSARKAVLKSVIPNAGALRFADHVEEHGDRVFEQVQQWNLEGMMAKDAASPYARGRSAKWLKVVAAKTHDFVIVGYTPPRGSRVGIGALHLARYQGKKLIYRGRVGTGFGADEALRIYALLEPFKVSKPAMVGKAPTGPANVWVAPKFVGEVRYRMLTKDGVLRQSSFLRLRLDKSPHECRESAATAETASADEPRSVPAVEKKDRAVHLTHLDKVFWPDEGYTKGDLIAYYDAVSPWLMPYLRDRPVVLTRYPDGITGKSFFQKDAPSYVPDWVRTERIWSGHVEREIDYFVADAPQTLSYLVNLGTIPLHIWSSRVHTLGQPDWCILDLDPKGAPFANVIALAKEARRLCEEIGVNGYLKTSGSTGLHILVPLAQQFTYEQSRTFGNLMARELIRRHPDIATIERALGARRGRVYVDFLQNRHGQLLVAPYSVRPLPGAPVSTPLRWDELTPRLSPSRFTIKTMPQRLKRHREDPVLPVLHDRPDLGQALERLANLIGVELASTTPL